MDYDKLCHCQSACSFSNRAKTVSYVVEGIADVLLSGGVGVRRSPVHSSDIVLSSRDDALEAINDLLVASRTSPQATVCVEVLDDSGEVR